MAGRIVTALVSEVTDEGEVCDREYHRVTTEKQLDMREDQI
jgi:hypothetical protein